MAARLLVGILIAAPLDFALQLPAPLWTVAGIMVTLPVMGRPTFSGVLWPISAVGLGCLLGYVIGFLFVQQPPLQILAITAVAAVSTYLQVWGGFRPVCFLIISMFSLVVAYPAVVTAQGGGSGAWIAFAEVSVGILIAAILNLTLWPESATARLRAMLSSKLARASQLPPHSPRDPSAPDAPPFIAEPDRLSTQLAVLRDASAEDHLYARRAGAWTTIGCAIESYSQGVSQYRDWESSPERALTSPEIIQSAAACHAALTEAAKTLANRIATETPGAIEQEPPSPLAAADEALAHLKLLLRPVSGMTGPHPAAHAIVACIRQRETLAIIADEHQFAMDTADPVSDEDHAALRIPPLFPLDPIIVEIATKLAVSVLICLMLGTIGNWSLGTLLVTTTAFMGATATMGSLVQRIELRFLGVIAGVLAALIGRVYLLPHFESVAGLDFALLLLCAPIGYVSICGPNVSLLGFQALLILAAALLTDTRLSDDVGIVLNRVSAILLCAIVLIAVQRFVQPATATRVLPTRLSRLSTGLAKLLWSYDTPAAGARGGQFESARFAVSTQLWAVADVIADSQHELNIGLPLLDQDRGMDAMHSARRMTRRIDDARSAYKRLLKVTAPVGSEPLIKEIIGVREACHDALQALGAQWTTGDLSAVHAALQRARESSETADRVWAEIRHRADYGEWSIEWLAAARGRLTALQSLAQEIAHASEIAGPTTLNRPSLTADASIPSSSTSATASAAA